MPIPVDVKNWPGAILPGVELVRPKPSSFVDDDFDPLINSAEKYLQLENYPPYYSFNVPNPVDVKNWPGAILPGVDLVRPKPSSFVDDDFDPLFNSSEKYIQLDEDAKFSGKPITLAMLEI